MLFIHLPTADNFPQTEYNSHVFYAVDNWLVKFVLSAFHPFRANSGLLVSGSHSELRSLSVPVAEQHDLTYGWIRDHPS